MKNRSISGGMEHKVCVRMCGRKADDPVAIVFSK